MSVPVASNSRMRHSYSPSRNHYYPPPPPPPPPPPHHSQHPPMWQPHVHHHSSHRPVHSSHPHAHHVPQPHHHYHIPPPPPVNHGRHDENHRSHPVPTAHPEHHVYATNRRDHSDHHYPHRHRMSYPPVHHPRPTSYSSAPWKRQKIEESSQPVAKPVEPPQQFVRPSREVLATAIQSAEKTTKDERDTTKLVHTADKLTDAAPQVVSVECLKERKTDPGNHCKSSETNEVFQQLIKSPVTMCFERFLGAAEVLAQKSASRKRESIILSKENQAPNVVCPSSDHKPVPQVHTPPSHRPVRLIDKFPGAKGVSEEDEACDENNPFQEIANDRELQRKVILHMALQRNVGDDPGDIVEEIVPTMTGAQKMLIEDGFYWKEFPVCEAVLYKHMADYYGISSVQRQSKMQQSFNKMLVEEVRKAAREAGIKFDPSFTEKKLRDRIRCFYKTHLQNAKKRLVTLQKRPDSESNKAIVRVYIRCVKTGISFAESLYMEPNCDNQANKRGRLSHVEKAKLALKREMPDSNQTTTSTV